MVKKVINWLLNAINDISLFFNSKSEISNMTNTTRKQIVENVAREMCKQENRLSTKRLKIELRNQYPDELWNKYTGGGIHGVSDIFHTLVGEGKFVSIANNGTYQTYADVTLPIKSRKGDSYIADMEEQLIPGPKVVMSIQRGTVKQTANLGTALKASSKAATQTATAPTKSAAKQAAVAMQPRSANGRFAHKTVKTTSRTGGKASANKKPITHNIPAISKSKALTMMENTNGEFVATFVKKDQSIRVMRAQYESTNPLGYVVAEDLDIQQTRNINVNTLISLTVANQTYRVK